MTAAVPMPSLGRQRLACVLAGAALFACTCDDDPAGPLQPPPAVTTREVWIGRYAADAPDIEHGVMRIDIATTGGQASGRVVLRSRVAEDPDIAVDVLGASRNDSLILGPDPRTLTRGFEVRAARTAGRLTGALDFAEFALRARVDCAPVELDSIHVQASYALDTSVLGLAFDGTRLWVSTTEEYQRFDLAGQYVDSVVVFYRPATRWTSDALTSDGSRLWGHLPLAVDSSGTVFQRSVLVEFTLAGEITARTDLYHRIDGLAHDGTQLWSLSGAGELLRLDDAGTVLERIATDVPDLVDIAADGQRFWGIGWYDPRLYEIDLHGRVVRVYDLPDDPIARFPSALDYDGESLWYASAAGFQRRSRLLRLGPVR